MKLLLLGLLLSAAATFGQPSTRDGLPPAPPTARDSARYASPSRRATADTVARWEPPAPGRLQEPAAGGPQSSPTPAPTQAVPAEPGLHPALAGLIGFVLGGVLVGWLLSRRSKQAAEDDDARIDRKYRVALTEFQQRYNRLEGDKIRLEMQLDELRRHGGARSGEAPAGRGKPGAGDRSPPPPRPTPAAEPVPAGAPGAGIDVGETIALAVEPAAPTRHYAPAPETNFLEDRLLNPQPLEHLPLEITLDPATPHRARFTLSPHVDQALIIGDGVSRLSEFFAFERPDKVRTLHPGAPGELAREDGGWRVVRKAGLELR